MSDIGIVGAGTAGLHLALLLQSRGLEPTLYAERTADEVLRGRLANTVVHNYRTRAREREIGANLWDETAPPIEGHWHSIPHEHGRLDFPGYFPSPSLSVDYRIYQSRLLELFEERGGKAEVGQVGRDDLGRLAGRHDLVVVSTGRGGLVDLFPAIPGRSPFAQPARRPLRRSLPGDRGHRGAAPRRAQPARAARRDHQHPDAVARRARRGAALRVRAGRRSRRGVADAVRGGSEGARPARAGQAPHLCATGLRAGRRDVVRRRRPDQHPAGSDRPDRP